MRPKSSHPNPIFFSNISLFPTFSSLPLPVYLLLPRPSERLIILRAPFHARLPSIRFLLPPSGFLPPALLPSPHHVLRAPLRAAINLPVVFPLVLLKHVLGDGINQHQVWHLPEDTGRTSGWSGGTLPTPVHFTLWPWDGCLDPLSHSACPCCPRPQRTRGKRRPGLIFPLGGVPSVHGYLIFKRVKAD